MRITTFAYYKTTQSMKRKIIMALLAAICTTTVANETIEVSVNNPLKQTRTDQPVVISLKQYGDVHSALVTTDGKEIACQLDDLDQDEQYDELCFLADLGSKEKRKYIVTL